MSSVLTTRVPVKSRSWPTAIGTGGAGNTALGVGGIVELDPDALLVVHAHPRAAGDDREDGDASCLDRRAGVGRKPIGREGKEGNVAGGERGQRWKRRRRRRCGGRLGDRCRGRAATGERGDRDGGGDHRGGGSTCCSLTFGGAQLACQRLEGPEETTDREPAGDGPPPLDQRRAQRGARGAVGEVLGRVEALLPSRIARRNREEHGPAARIREFDAAEGEHELEAQECPGTRQAHRDSARRRFGVRGERGGVDAVDFVEEQKLAVLLGEREPSAMASASFSSRRRASSSGSPMVLYSTSRWMWRRWRPSLRYLVTIRLRAVTAA